MFENLTNFFNAQSTLVQIIIVAVVTYVVYMIYVEFTKEKFGGTINACNNSGTDTITRAARSGETLLTLNSKTCGTPNRGLILYTYKLSDGTSVTNQQNWKVVPNAKFVRVRARNGSLSQELARVG